MLPYLRNSTTTLGRCPSSPSPSSYMGLPRPMVSPRPDDVCRPFAFEVRRRRNGAVHDAPRPSGSARLAISRSRSSCSSMQAQTSCPSVAGTPLSGRRGEAACASDVACATHMQTPASRTRMLLCSSTQRLMLMSRQPASFPSLGVVALLRTGSREQVNFVTRRMEGAIASK